MNKGILHTLQYYIVILIIYLFLNVFLNNNSTEALKLKLIFVFVMLGIAAVMIFINSLSMLLIKYRMWHKGSLFVHFIVLLFCLVLFINIR